jgi:methylenetetrahydrofolate dehydrogenase (NADP+)/methenyltetrahydrofolate cyclohydrolase
MVAKIISGKLISEEIENELKAQIAEFARAPELAIIMVGNDYASDIYVKNKQKAAAKIGMVSHFHHLDEDISEEELLNIIEQLNNDKEVNGIIVQLPLPEGFDTHRIINAISPLKDVDGFHPMNTGKLQNNDKPYFIAATPLGIMRLLNTVCDDLSGKNAVIIGASLIVGRPLATLLLNQGCTVSVTHSETKNITNYTNNADIIVAACGVAKLVKADWIKDGAILIDVGINRLENGKICGDIDFEDTKEKAEAITPVPGGVGPMTIAMLLYNTVQAYKLQNF